MARSKLWMLMVLFAGLVALAQPGPNSPQPTWASPPLSHMEEALKAYQDMSGKTLLRSSSLPGLPESIIADLPPEKDKALARIENNLTSKGIEVIQDGPHFVRIFAKGARDCMTNAPLGGAGFQVVGNEEIIQAGMINFPGTRLDAFLRIYAELRQRNILRSAILPAPDLKLTTVCPLTRQEAAYAMTTTLALNGLVAVDDGERFVQVGTQDQLKMVKTLAPKPVAGAELFDPKKIPTVGVNEDPIIQSDIERNIRKAKQLFYDFIHQPDPRHQYADRLVRLYADLTDKETVPSKHLGQIFVRFSMETALTKEELLYAIKTTLVLNNLALIEVDAKTVRLGHISEIVQRSRQ